jgi:hypothetical protein
MRVGGNLAISSGAELRLGGSSMPSGAPSVGAKKTFKIRLVIGATGSVSTPVVKALSVGLDM